MKYFNINFEKKETEHYFFIGFIVIYFFANFFSKYIDPHNEYRFTSIVNLAFEITLILFFLRKLLKKQRLLIPLILTTVFLIGQWFLIEREFNISSIDAIIFEVTKGHILQLNNYLLVFVFFVAFKLIEDYEVLAIKTFKLLEIIFYLNSAFVLIGLITGIDYFKTYPNSNRFGYLGLFNANTFAVYYYCIILTYLYRQYLLGKNKLLHILYLICIGLLLGKKAFLLFLGLLTIYHFRFLLKISAKKLYLFLIGCLVIIYLLREKILDLIFTIFPFWEKIYNNGGWLSLITSYRNIRFREAYEQVMSTWRLPNFLFGGTIIPTYRTEWGFVDLYLFFGATGLFIYLFWFLKLFSQVSRKHAFLLLLILIIAFFVGGFFVNVNLMIFYVLLIILFQPNLFHKTL